MTCTESHSLPIAHLDTIGLSDLDEAASLQMRKERKYLVPSGVLERMIEQADLRVLDIEGRRTFRYESVYFDTPDYASYLAAAYRRRRRFKVRTRSYLDSGTCLLEVKTRERRGLTAKHRLGYDVERRDHLTDEALEFICGFDTIGPVGRSLRPSLTTRYHRTTFLDPVSRSRITVDTGLECEAGDGSSVSLSGVAVVETKTSGPPCTIDRLLWAVHCRPTKVSKYGTGLAALTPALPANKWNRILRRYFDRSPRGMATELPSCSAESSAGSITRHPADALDHPPPGSAAPKSGGGLIHRRFPARRPRPVPAHHHASSRDDEEKP
jgi:hypothetical protein